MNESEWIKKADDDLRMAEVIIQSDNPPTWGVCYHCQQSAEKYLKAYLVASDIEFKELHDLVYLSDLCSTIEPDFKNIIDDFKALSPFAVTSRYPFVNLKEYTIEEATDAIEKAKKVKDFIKKKLGETK